MTRMRAGDFPLNEWTEHDTARCPECGGRPCELRRCLKVLGPSHLPGMQMKMDAAERWEGRCTVCGWTGPATPHPSGSR